jgi:hypothetical protein
MDAVRLIAVAELFVQSPRAIGESLRAFGDMPRRRPAK